MTNTPVPLPDEIWPRDLPPTELRIVRERQKSLLARLGRQDSMSLEDQAALAVINVFLAPNASPLTRTTLDWLIQLHMEALDVAEGERNTLSITMTHQIRMAYEAAARFLMHPERREVPRELRADYVQPPPDEAGTTGGVTT